MFYATIHMSRTAVSQWRACHSTLNLQALYRKSTGRPLWTPRRPETCSGLSFHLQLISVKSKAPKYLWYRSGLSHPFKTMHRLFLCGVTRCGVTRRGGQRGPPVWEIHFQHATAQTATSESLTGRIFNIVSPFSWIANLPMAAWPCPESNSS